MSRPSRLNVFKPGSRTRHVGSQCELLIERLADEGQGMAQWQGKRVFVDGALPGERVTVRIKSETRHGLQATLLGSPPAMAETPHSGRVAAPCRHYTDCGGCQLQHLNYSAQITHKQHVAQRRLHRQIPESRWLEPVVSTPWRYRHRARLQVRTRRGSVQLGFLRRGSDELVDIDECLQWYPQLEHALTTLRAALPGVSHVSRIEEVQLACGDGGEVGALFAVSRGFSANDIESLQAALAGEAWLLEVLERPANHLIWSNGRRPLVYPGRSALTFGPGDFTQANPEVNAAMVATTVSWLAPEPDERVLDFFAGLGNFSLPLAAAGCTVKAFEIAAAMVARGNAIARGAEMAARLTFTATDLFDPQALDALDDELASCRRVLLDPPRAGARLLCERLAAKVSAGQSAVDRIVYVSCNSLALGADLDALIAAGFFVECAQVYDMFPHTSHFETVVLLVRD